MERPKKKLEIQFYPEDGVDSARECGQDEGYNQCCTGYDLWLKEKLEGLPEIMAQVYTLPQHSYKVLDANLLADLASAIRGHFNEKD